MEYTPEYRTQRVGGGGNRRGGGRNNYDSPRSGEVPAPPTPPKL
jgi:hypothetical protein